jgi:hypothetical protein
MIRFSGAQIDQDKLQWKGVVPLDSKGLQFPSRPQRFSHFDHVQSPLHGHAIPTLTPLLTARLAMSIPLCWSDSISNQ